MNRWCTYLFLILFCFSCSMAVARPAGISGHVLDDYGKPLSFVSVLLVRTSDSVVVKTDLTNEKGSYDLDPVATGSYVIKAVLLGYETFTTAAVTVADNSITQQEIILHQNNTALKEVTVSVQKPFIEVKADKIVVNVENSIVSAGSTVMDVLQRSPGVSVDPDDNISLKGKQGVNIMIDGRTVPVSAADLANMLKGMPAGSVDKIEIISNPSAKYDAAGTAGIINIKTKKNQAAGFNASVNASYGQGVYPKQTAGFNLSFRQNKLSVYLNCNDDNRLGFKRVNWERRYYNNGVFTGSYVQDNHSLLKVQTNTAAAGIDYRLTDKTSIGTSVTGESFYLGIKGYYLATVHDQFDQPQSYFATHNNASGNWSNYAPNIHLKHTFDSTGKELTIDADYARYWNTNNQDFTTNYYLLNGLSSKPDYRLHANISGVTQIRAIKADYSMPLKAKLHIDAGAKASYVTADNEPRFYNRSSGIDVYDSSKSDHFIYHEQINAAYFNVSKEWEKWSTQVGLRGEQTIISGVERVTMQNFKNDYTQLFPSLALQRHLNKNNDLGVTVSRRIERPGYNELNPYKFFVDPSTYKEGNPYLKPALTYTAELSHTYKQRLITTLSYSYTKNTITEVIIPGAIKDRITIQTHKNLALMLYYGLSGSYTIPVFKWWNTITNYNAYYGKYEGELANTYLNKGQPSIDLSFNNKFTFPGDWTAELVCFYQAPQVYGYLNMSSYSIVNIGIQKNLLNKRLTLKLSGFDIFWDGNKGATSCFTDYTQQFIARQDTRQVDISASYRFGKRTVAAVRRHQGGAEEEKQRTGKG